MQICRRSLLGGTCPLSLLGLLWLYRLHRFVHFRRLLWLLELLEQHILQNLLAQLHLPSSSVQALGSLYPKVQMVLHFIGLQKRAWCCPCINVDLGCSALYYISLNTLACLFITSCRVISAACFSLWRLFQSSWMCLSQSRPKRLGPHPGTIPKGLVYVSASGIHRVNQCQTYRRACNYVNLLRFIIHNHVST